MYVPCNYMYMYIHVDCTSGGKVNASRQYYSTIIRNPSLYIRQRLRIIVFVLMASCSHDFFTQCIPTSKLNDIGTTVSEGFCTVQE